MCRGSTLYPAHQAVNTSKSRRLGKYGHLPLFRTSALANESQTIRHVLHLATGFIQLLSIAGTEVQRRPDGPERCWLALLAPTCIELLIFSTGGL